MPHQPNQPDTSALDALARSSHRSRDRSILTKPGEKVGEIVRFVSKSELERARLIREARAIYDSIFPPTAPARAERDREEAPPQN